MASILVTGATGRLGTALLPALLARGDKIRAVVRLGSTGSLPQGVEKVECDLSSSALPGQAFEGIQSIIHLAGLIGSHPYNELIASNANSTKNLISHCPSSVQKVVLASSISVYGQYAGQMVDEDFPLKTESPYGKSKLMAEEFARGYGDLLHLVFLRFGMIYGPGFQEGYFEVLRYISEGKMQIIGSGENRIPLVHASDAVAAILLAIDKPQARNREYNIVGAEQMTQKGLLTLAAAELGASPPRQHISPTVLSLVLGIGRLSGKKSLDPENIRQLSLDRAYSCERAKKELGWQPNVPLAQGMKEMVKLYKAKQTGD